VFSALFALAVFFPNDTVRLVGDTLRIEPLGVRVTVPALWMGRVPPDAAAFGQGRFGCQLNVSGPVSDRVVTDPSKFAEIITGIYGPVRSAQEALDSILPRSAMVANVGGDRFDGNCVAPKIHVYVADTTSLAAVPVASIAERVVERVFPGVKRTEADSASWHVVRLSWDDRQTDFFKPGTLEILMRRIRDRVLLVAVMDGWSGRQDTNEFLASIR
jgi:hypothetical protein